MDTYVRVDEKVPLTGILLLTQGRWSTLYFVPQPGTNEHWGSAESGRYTIDDDRLTFHHELAFQAGGGRDLLIDPHSATVETCAIELASETLKILFPSGNVIYCSRYSE